MEMGCKITVQKIIPESMDIIAPFFKNFLKRIVRVQRSSPVTDIQKAIGEIHDINRY